MAGSIGPKGLSLSTGGRSNTRTCSSSDNDDPAHVRHGVSDGPRRTLVSVRRQTYSSQGEHGLEIAHRAGAKLQIPESLESLAGAALERENAARAARLLGAAACVRQAIGAPLAPVDRAAHEEAIAAARAALGDTAYDAICAEGSVLTLDEAVAYALGEVEWDELAGEVAARLEVGEGGAPRAGRKRGSRPRRRTRSSVAHQVLQVEHRCAMGWFFYPAS